MTTDRIAVGERDSRTRLPMLQASNLSPHYYTAREWYDREVDRIFLKEWQCVGRVEQVERPGDYFTTEIVGEPVLIVRDGDGEVRALSGVCRHRAQVIASGAGHVRNFQCPYHGWTYSLTGDLIGAPGMREAEGFDRRAHCLPSLPVEIWEGFIFINFDPGCEPLAPALQGLSRRLARYRLGDMVCTSRVDYDVDCNWKVFMDGQEGYHLSTVHSSTITASLPKDACYTEEPHGSYEVLVFRNLGKLARRTLTGESPFPLIGGLTESELGESPYAIVYPTFQIPVSIDGASYLYVLPQGPERCRVMTGICFPRSTLERPDFEEVAQQYYTRWDIVMKEDLGVCESSQKGLRSRFYQSGRYAPMEEFVYRFHNYVLDRVG